MKKAIFWILVLLLLLSLFGCRQHQREVTCTEVADAYEAAGCEVFHAHGPSAANAWNCYVTAKDLSTGDSIYLHFFDTPEQAEEYAATRQYNLVIWLFSVIYGDPSWLHTATYQNIEIEYTGRSLYAVFNALTETKFP